MKKEVHLAALNAASKVAFSVAVLAGCSSSEPVEQGASPSQESEVRSNACGGKKFTCDDLVKAVFPTPGNYPGQSIATSAQVKQCCTELLQAKGAQLENRWDCCANRAPTADAGENSESELNLFVACTPWGPPVPPAFERGVT
jgi:hypothetical protein